MYTAVQLLHSWLRWVVIIAAVVATGATFTTPASQGEDAADRWGLIFMMSLDLQMLLGVLLYFALSPTTAVIMQNFGAAMQDPVARFWAVEHITTMFIAVILVHVGRVMARKARTPGSKRMRQMICFTLATVLIIAGTPWPGLAAGRPLFRV
jgi:heme A synthase